MTVLRSPPGALNNTNVAAAAAATAVLNNDMPMTTRSPKLIRTNSSKKVSAATNLERAILSFKSWEAAAGGGCQQQAPTGADDKHTAGGVPAVRRIQGARPGRLTLLNLDSPASTATTRHHHHHHYPAAMAVVPRSSSSSPPNNDNTNTTTRSPLHEAEAAAATTVQKMFKGHRTRRTMADCAIVIEELWWKLYDSASLDRRSISFFTGDTGKRETAASRWVRAGKRVAKVAKGLCNDDKAQKLALRHWLEAIDPRHRYGHNLHLYYDIWFQSSSTQPFFYWLDIGGGREIHHPSCPRPKLNSQLVMYLGMNERAAYQVVVKDGRLTYLQSRQLVNTTDESKWIFVLSTTRSLYVGQKKKGQFQHSSFLAGAATSAAGRLVAKDGVLKAIWPYSGHYLPTEENFNQFIAFLQDNNVDLTHVKRCSVDDDEYPSLKRKQSTAAEEEECETSNSKETAAQASASAPPAAPATAAPAAGAVDHGNDTASRAVVLKWTSGAGARIGCVRDYPAELQRRALEQVNLSPNRPSPWAAGKAPMPLPSPRPSPRVRLSPRVQYMGVPTASPGGRPPLKQQCLGLGFRHPTVHLTLPSNKSTANKATSSAINR